MLRIQIQFHLTIRRLDKKKPETISKNTVFRI